MWFLLYQIHVRLKSLPKIHLSPVSVAWHLWLSGEQLERRFYISSFIHQIIIEIIILTPEHEKGQSLSLSEADWPFRRSGVWYARYLTSFSNIFNINTAASPPVCLSYSHTTLFSQCTISKPLTIPRKSCYVHTISINSRVKERMHQLYMDYSFLWSITECRTKTASTREFLPTDPFGGWL